MCSSTESWSDRTYIPPADFISVSVCVERGGGRGKEGEGKGRRHIFGEVHVQICNMYMYAAAS